MGGVILIIMCVSEDLFVLFGLMILIVFLGVIFKFKLERMVFLVLGVKKLRFDNVSNVLGLGREIFWVVCVLFCSVC